LQPIPSAAIEGELLEVNDRGIVLAAPNTEAPSVKTL